MIANILFQNGIRFGESLIGSSRYNREGHFEDRFIVGMNKKILLHYGTTWCTPKDFPSDWLQDSYIQKLRIQALGYAEKILAKNREFAFKDPRTCLTLPFWESVWGDMLYIIILRNQEDVVKSVLKRNEAWRSKKYFFWRGFRFLYHLYLYNGAYEKIIPINETSAMKLWNYYNAQLCRFTENKDKIVVRYESILNDPEIEVQKVLEFIKSEKRGLWIDAVKPHYDHGEKNISKETEKMYDLLSKYK